MGDKDQSNIKALREIKESFYVEKCRGDKDKIFWIRDRQKEKKSIKQNAANGS